ncbi:MAG: hypothetical protein AAGF47_05320 [Planctomycetota bacterium]
MGVQISGWSVHRRCIVAFVMIVGVASQAVAQAVRLDRVVPERVETAIRSLADGGDAGAIAGEMLALRDAAAVVAEPNEFRALAEAEAGLRIARLIETLGAEDGGRLAGLAVEHPELVRRLVFELDADHDEHAAAARLLLRLIDATSPGMVDEFGSLAVAIAVVHDAPLIRRVNENTVEAGDPVELFRYFVANARQAQIDPRRLPTELLVFAVSSTERIDQLEWARQRYRADKNHGRRFFEIQYDLEHYRTGRPKAVSLAPRYCLAAISELGGVCADQAYFAEHVAKSVGVPSAYMHGRAGEVSHAWLGYLTVSRNRYVWDFDAGRYDDYQGVRGSTTNPQTGRPITDGELAMRAGNAMLKEPDRWRAIALKAAAQRLDQLNEQQSQAAADAVFEGRDALRWDRPEHRLELLEASVRICPGDTRAWRQFARLASSGDVDGREIDRWLRAFERSGGRQSLDMLVDLLDMLLAAVPDASARIDVLEWAMPKLRGRSDLQAWVRLTQGAVLEGKGDKANAWRAYEDVVRRFVNDGPFAIDAVDRMLAMLDGASRPGHDIELLRRAFDEAEQPFSVGSFRTQSNWYRLGQRLAVRLEEAGRTKEAEHIVEQIGLQPMRRLGG